MVEGVKVSANTNFNSLSGAYLFSEVRRRVADFERVGGCDIINLGVGDVAYPLPPSVISALHSAVEELGDNMRFKGYPKENGYDFLKGAIVNYYKRLGVCVGGEEVFVSDGAKSDASNFLDVFEPSEVVIPTPVYPVYLDSAIMRGCSIKLLKCERANDFKPTPDVLDDSPKIIWLCSPNNPTGVALSVEEVKKWVDYALKTGSLILYDGAYSAFAGEGVVKSVFEVDGAKECAVEFCSFSKFAGFTNLRLSWVVVPYQLKAMGKSLNYLWARRQSAKFNGVSYPVQRAGEVALSLDGVKECTATINKYMSVARKLRAFLCSKDIWCIGGEHSPYVWMECPWGMASWQFFDYLLYNTGIVGTPGVGFGVGGEGYFRLSCFAREDSVFEVIERMGKIFKV